MSREWRGSDERGKATRGRLGRERIGGDSSQPRYMEFVGYFGGTMCFAGIVMGVVLCRWFL